MNELCEFLCDKKHDLCLSVWLWKIEEHGLGLDVFLKIRLRNVGVDSLNTEFKAKLCKDSQRSVKLSQSEGCRSLQSPFQ